MNIVVVGLGSVGLPLGVWLASKGNRVLGVDINGEHVNSINSGYPGLLEAGSDNDSFSSLLQSCLSRGTFAADTEYRRIGEGDNVFLVTVGVPIEPAGQCDHGPVISAITSLAKVIRQGDLVVIKSTLVPGSMHRLILPLLQQSGLIPGEDFALAYCPERLAEGSAFADLDTVPRLVSAEDELSLNKALDFWSIVSQADSVPVRSFLVAELSKVVENMYRDVNIAFSNELFPLVSRLGLDFFQLQAAANTHPRVEILTPGPGVGGHCIPNAFFYLSPLADQYRTPLDLGATGRKVNDGRSRQVAHSVISICHRLRGEITSAVILGIGMKDYCSDIRHSPALALEDVFKNFGVKVQTFDPLLQSPAEDMAALLEGKTAAIVTAFQNGMGPAEIIRTVAGLQAPPILFDTRGTLPRHAACELGVEVYYV